MSDSKEKEKKIVFRRGLLAPKESDEPVLPDEIIEQQEREEQEARQKLLTEGEVFDQFYNTIGQIGGVQKLAELAQDIAPPPQVPPRLRPEEFHAREALHQELAEALAHQIYQLAQQQRVGDVDLYLSAINVVVGDKTPKEARDILEKANTFFTEHYYTLIRDRGERPEISHQIIKRVGHERAETITRIAEGLDIEQAARDLWELYYGADNDREAQITEALLTLTELQMAAVREEFLLLPFKHLAQQAHAILNPKEQEVQPAGRRSIGGNEVGRKKKQEALRVSDDSRALNYLFLGRSVREMELIKRFYCDFGRLEQDENEIGLFAHIQNRFKPIQIDRLGSLLDGWSPQQEAIELHAILYPSTLRSGIEDAYSDPLDPAERDYTQGLGAYLRKFSKSRMWRGKDSVHHRTLNAFDVIAERVAALSPERFLATNQALYDSYGYELDPLLFPSLAIVEPRLVAQVIAERMDCTSGLLEALAPLLYSPPKTVLAVQQAYEVVFGRKLRDDLNAAFPDEKPTHDGHKRSVILERYLDGQGRVPVHVDILARYRGDEPASSVWDYSYKSTETDEQDAMACAQLLDYEGAVGDQDKPIYEFLSGKDVDALHRMERAFYDLTEPPMALRDALANCLANDTFSNVDLLFAGIDLPETVAHLYSQPTAISELASLPPSLISAINQGFQKTHFVSLSDFLLEQFSHSNAEDLLLENLSVALLPEIYAGRKCLREASRMMQDEIDPIRAQVSSSLLRALGFERGFDMVFPRLRVHIKRAAARGAITPPTFAELMLYLEGIEPDVNARLLQYFDAVDIDMVIELLRTFQHGQSTIEQTFDLLNPESPLRRSIKEMKVDLEPINEVLLHLDGYSAKDVADELHSFVEALPTEELGEALLRVFEPSTKQRPNPRIPEDVNWMDEMNYQILLAYHRQYDEDLMKVAWSKNLDPNILLRLTQRLFGSEVCSTAEDIFVMLQRAKEGTPLGVESERRLCSQVASKGIRFRGLLVRAYNAYWAHQPGYSSLLDDVAKFIEDSQVKRTLHTLLIGVGVDIRATRSTSKIIQ